MILFVLTLAFWPDRALVRALLEFAGEVEAEVIAEGIETPKQQHCLRELGVHYGQGYLLGRPGPGRALAPEYALV
jgi:EAL domain-containing protein (putative c-di-GMP-specific phosphodiesterase class I)